MSAVTVQTRDGQLEGEQRAGHVAFRGIPFARAPLGDLRFRAPQPVEPWSGVRAAKEFGPSAPQSPTNVVGMSADGPLSEDCLYLNVYAPALDRKPRPVLFWIHGGAFSLGSGSAPLYDGASLCRRGDVVVVTCNYRLGALGFAQLAAFGGERIAASANCGLLDQIAALTWVRDNISQFGGDANNVTIFGESAGASSVCMLTVMPAAQGLFHRAIAQSPFISVPTSEAAGHVVEGLFTQLGLRPGDIEQLCALRAEQIVTAQGAAAAQAGLMRGFGPTEDAATLPSQPSDAIARGGYAKVPLLIGTNRDEMNLFNAPLLRTLEKPMTNEQAAAVLARQLPGAAADRLPELLEIYRASRERRGLPHSNRALLGAIEGDARFRIPSVRFAEAYRSAQPNTFMYLFTYESPAMRGALRSCHALEIPFVFGTLDAPTQDRFAGTGPLVEKLSETMMECWLAFARSSLPSHPLVGDWPPFDVARRPTMVFDTHTRLEEAPFEDERAAWDAIAL